MAQSPPSALEDHLGYWLRLVSNHVSHAFRREVEACGVKVSEWVVLRALYGAEGATPGALVQLLGVTKGAVSKLVERLVERGLVTRATSEVDRRQQALGLTPRGRALVPRLARLADENDRAYFAHMDPRTRAAVLRAMQEIVEIHQLNGAPID